MRLVFLADTQFGAYATFSGMSDDQVADYRARGLRVDAVPRVEGAEWESRRYEAAVGMVNALRPALVIVGGDMIDDAASAEQLDELMRITRKLDPDIPMRWAPGNHDIAVDAVAPTPHSIEKYREAFGPDYYAFGSHGVRLVVMNTVVIDHPENVTGHLEEQFAFLEYELERTPDSEQVILVGHHPLFVESAAEPDTYWNIPRERRRRILDLIHRNRVRFGLAGHWHRNAIAFDGGFEMVTSGPVGYPLGDDPSGLRIVDVDGARISHEYRPIEGVERLR